MKQRRKPPKAPGKFYRKGLSLAQLFKMFPDDETAERWLVQQRWPDAVGCPKCGSINIQERKTRKPQPYRCRDCRRDFSVKTDSLMHSSPLGCQKWVIAIYLVTTNLKGVSSMKLHRDLGISQKSAWHLLHRIRENFKDHPVPFLGPVEVDEAYMGGKRKFMHAKKRRQFEGRDTVGKTAVVGMKDRATNQVSAKVVQDTKHKTLRGFVTDRIEPGTQVYTDDSGAYAPLPNHESAKHSVGEYVRGMAHTNGVESFWAMLKRAHSGTYHKMSPKHLQRYVTEFSGRHNVRKRDTLEQMGMVVRGMDLKRLMYRDLIADNDLPSGARE